jgi:thymidylate synthase
MNPTKQEQQVFNSLSQSGEGDVVRKYLERVRQHIASELFENEDSDNTDLEGVRQARKIIDTLSNQFKQRDIITETEPERFD